MIKVKINKINDNAIVPEKQTSGSSGFDLYACIENDLTIKPLDRVLIPTGLTIEVPNGYEAQVRPRSGLAYKNGISVLNSPGTIDSDYRGEVCVILINLSNDDFTITNEMRIAQMVISKIPEVIIKVTAELSETNRGNGGFGSTGV